MNLGTYALGYGLVAVVTDPPPTVPVPLVGGDRSTVKCVYTRLSARSCQCWRCAGLAKPRWLKGPDTVYTP